ncbi:hypothetical protein [Candidatus Ichthyocystis hellenicum]|uniref:hypothetical protein n=1 Tax=Candidatus Ichthyocystis hellenicum TaxID=1561003 RepID=UPI000B89B81E|nr:hypothetical protein [Candidatus Ichthyocystis hellenicum]
MPQVSDSKDHLSDCSSSVSCSSSESETEESSAESSALVPLLGTNEDQLCEVVVCSTPRYQPTESNNESRGCCSLTRRIPERLRVRRCPSVGDTLINSAAAIIALTVISIIALATIYRRIFPSRQRRGYRPAE